MIQKILRIKVTKIKRIYCLFLGILNLCLVDSQKHCCSNILLESDKDVHKIQGERLGFYTQLGYYGARPAYRQDGGHFFLFYHEDEQKWIDSHYFYGATLFSKLVNDMDAYCLDAYDNWSFYNRSELMYSENLMTNCSKVEDVCCHEINISSANSELKYGDKSFYDEQPKESLGNYKSIGMLNGRYVYQKDNLDRFLEYGERYWLVNTGVGKGSGHIHHAGGSVCPEHIKNEWQIADKSEDDSWVWKDDTKLEITCVNKRKEINPKHSSHTLGPVAQPFVQIDSVDTASYSSGTIVFGCITILLLAIMTIYFGKRFHKSWGKGAHGKQLIFETLDME